MPWRGNGATDRPPIWLEADERSKLREYEALGIEPRRWPDGKIQSAALLRTLGKLPKVEGAKAKGKAKARAA